MISFDTFFNEKVDEIDDTSEELIRTALDPTSTEQQLYSAAYTMVCAMYNTPVEVGEDVKFPNPSAKMIDDIIAYTKEMIEATYHPSELPGGFPLESFMHDMSIIGEINDFVEDVMRANKMDVCYPFFQAMPDEDVPCAEGEDCQNPRCVYRKMAQKKAAENGVA